MSGRNNPYDTAAPSRYRRVVGARETWTIALLLVTACGASETEPGMTELPATGELWSYCEQDTECNSELCFTFGAQAGDEWVTIGGLCSYLAGAPENHDACVASGGVWYMPGCVSEFCLPACEGNIDCPADLTCGGWNGSACGFWDSP